MMGYRGRVNLPLVRLKPDPIIVRSDSQGGDAIQELVYGRELYWIQPLGKFRADVKIAFDDPRGHRRRNSRTGGHEETT